MQPHDIELWRVACDPVAYHHRWQYLRGGLSGNPRSAVNAALAAQHGLIAGEGGSALGPQARRLIQGWQHLPHAAELLALVKQPRAAMAHPGFLHLPDSMRRFLKLGFAPAVQARNRPMGREQLRAWGAGYLAHGLAPSLPYWLAQRLVLPFESIHEGTGTCPESFDHSCFWSALRHAQTTSIAARH